MKMQSGEVNEWITEGTLMNDSETAAVIRCETPEGTLACVRPAAEEDLERQAVTIREQEEVIRSQETRLRVAERDLAVERARADELFARMVRVENAAAHPERTAGFKEERRRMWNQINLIGVIGGLCLGCILAVMAVLAST